MKVAIRKGDLHELDNAFDELEKAIDGVLSTVAFEIERKARASNAFKDKSGKLRKSIHARKSKYADGGWIVRATVPYAHLVEYGHDLYSHGRFVKYIPPSPYLRPAADSTRILLKGLLDNFKD